MANITESLIDSFIPTIVAAEALQTLKERKGLAKFVNIDYAADIATRGDSVRVPFYGSLGTADNKLPNTAFVNPSPSDTQVSIELDQHRYKRFLIEDTAKAKSQPNVMVGYLKEAMHSVLNDMETSIVTIADTFSNNVVKTGAPAVSYEDITKLRKTLVESKAPIDGPFIFAASVGDYQTLLVDNNISKALDYGTPIVVQQAKIPAVSGMGIFETQNVTNSFAMHRDAIALAVRDLSLDGNGFGVNQRIIRDEEAGLSFRLTVGYDADQGGTFGNVELLYGISLLRDELGVRLTGV